MENLRMQRISRYLLQDFERFGFVFIGNKNSNKIEVFKFYDINKAIKMLNTNPNSIFIQVSTAKKLGVIE